ncbi:hypothetical protein COCOBI_12-2090 [Coccomyxa sp. Obi]|nr:hypothetical protein COCOBI_12-2090 [Coccomyxa sp. Obi]
MRQSLEERGTICSILQEVATTIMIKYRDGESGKSFDSNKQAVLPELRRRPNEMLPKDARLLENPVHEPGAWGSPSKRVPILTHVDEHGNTYWETETGVRLSDEEAENMGLVQPPQWSNDEVKIFADGLAQSSRDFHEIARLLGPDRNTQDVVQFYYHVWKPRRVPEARTWAEGKQRRAELHLMLLRNQQKFLRAIQRSHSNFTGSNPAAQLAFLERGKYDKFHVNSKNEALSVFDDDAGDDGNVLSNGYGYLLALLPANGELDNLKRHLSTKQKKIKLEMASHNEYVQKLLSAAREGEPAAAGQKRARSNSGSPQGLKQKHKRRKTSRQQAGDPMDVDDPMHVDDPMDVDDPPSATDEKDLDWRPPGDNGKPHARTRRLQPAPATASRPPGHCGGHLQLQVAHSRSPVSKSVQEARQSGVQALLSQPHRRSWICRKMGVAVLQVLPVFSCRIPVCDALSLLLQTAADQGSDWRPPGDHGRQRASARSAQECQPESAARQGIAAATRSYTLSGPPLPRWTHPGRSRTAGRRMRITPWMLLSLEAAGELGGEGAHGNVVMPDEVG